MRAAGNPARGRSNTREGGARKEQTRVPAWRALPVPELPADLGPYDFFVPDTFAPTARTHPDTLEPFQAFNLRMARAWLRTRMDPG